ncbi:MAG: PEP-CTERM sorting domain-containing protein [Opitutales bacterium]
MTAQVSVSVDYLFEATDVFDPNELFTAAYEPAFNDLSQTSVVYRPGGSTSGFAVTFDNGDIPTLGAFDEDPQDFTFDDFFFFEDQVFDVYGAFETEGLLSMGSIFATDAEFVEADFVGTGEVTALSISTFVELAGSATLDNHGEPGLEITISLAGGEATLQYEYEPIPEPSTYAAIFGGLALGAALLRRRLRRS